MVEAWQHPGQTIVNRRDTAVGLFLAGVVIYFREEFSLGGKLDVAFYTNGGQIFGGH